MIKRSVQPFLWLLFSAGGMVTAMLAPIIVTLFGIIFPLGLVAPPGHRRMLDIIDYPLAREALLGVCILALFHCAHRLSYILRDGLQLQHLKHAIATICYSSAVAGSIISGYIVLPI
jgi:fumarate reductase subunit D